MSLVYHWQKYIKSPVNALRPHKVGRTSDDLFNRKTFTLSDRQQKNTLSQLRKMGGKRWFHFAWNIWNKRNPVDREAMSPCLSLAHDKFWTKEPTFIIDAGCGESADIDVLHHWGIKHIGFDLFQREEERVFNLTSMNGSPACTVRRKSSFRIQDICEPWQKVKKQSVDFVFSNAVIDLLTDDERYLFYRNSYAALKKNGSLIQYALTLKNGHGYSKYKEIEKLKEVGFVVTRERGLIVATKA